MAKLSKDELLKKITEKITDEDLVIELMEDISDSLDVSTEEEKKVLEDKITELELKLEDLKTKYKERFLKGNDLEEKEIEIEIEEPKEEEVIDIKEI